MQGSHTSLRTSLSAVLAALHHLEEVHNRRFIQATTARTSDADGPQTSAGSWEAPRDVSYVSDSPPGPIRIGPDVADICGTLGLRQSSHFRTPHRLLQETQTGESEKTPLHVLDEGAAKPEEDQDLVSVFPNLFRPTSS